MTALLFDCDGTLADTMPAHCEAWLDALRMVGVKKTADDIRGLAGVSTDVAAARLLGPITAIHTASLVSAKAAAFERYLHLIVPIRPVLDIVAAHRGLVPMAVVTGGLHRTVELILERLQIRDAFQEVIAMEDVERPKPAPDGFLLAADYLGVAPADCTVYEDSDLGLEAARRAGMRCVDVRSLGR